LSLSAVAGRRIQYQEDFLIRNYSAASEVYRRVGSYPRRVR
jgi:hypothetical protein